MVRYDTNRSYEIDTTHTDMFSFSHPETNNTVILLDTPGFDDTDRSDTEILKEISCFCLLYTSDAADEPCGV